MEDDGDFEKNDQVGSYTYPAQAGALKKGGYVMLKGKPCKIMEITTSKPGKHGHAKANFVGIDIFTEKKYEDSTSTSHNMDVPNVSKAEYQLLDIDADGYVTLMSDSGDTRQDLKLPDDEDLKKRMIKDFKDDKSIQVTVVSAIGLEKILTFRDN